MSRRNPWMKWYPADWRAETTLRMCSLAARGLWIELLGIAHEATPYGHVLVKGAVPSVAQIAGLVGRPLDETSAALEELRAAEVFTVVRGIIVCRRMVTADAVSAESSMNGKLGGNPSLIPPDADVGVNPLDNVPDKPLPLTHATRVPDARSQIPEAVVAEARADAGTVGRQVLEIMGVWNDPRWHGNYGRVHVWLAQGADPEADIYPTLKRMMAQRKGEPPRSLTYFDDAIVHAITQRTRPLPSPKAPTDDRTETDEARPGDRSRMSQAVVARHRSRAV